MKKKNERKFLIKKMYTAADTVPDLTEFSYILSK